MSNNCLLQKLLLRWMSGVMLKEWRIWVHIIGSFKSRILWIDEIVCSSTADTYSVHSIYVACFNFFFTLSIQVVQLMMLCVLVLISLHVPAIWRGLLLVVNGQLKTERIFTNFIRWLYNHHGLWARILGITHMSNNRIQLNWLGWIRWVLLH